MTRSDTLVCDPVMPPSRVRPGISEDLERVLLRCLAKEPAERFPDAEGLERALGACACAGDWDRDRAARWWQDDDLRADAGDVQLSWPRRSCERRRSFVAIREGL